MTLQIDDAGVGDLLSGVIIGAYRPETDRFDFEMVDVHFFQKGRFRRKAYLTEVVSAVLLLVKRLGLSEEEPIQICSSFVFDKAVKELRSRYGESRVTVVKIVGKAQDKTEKAYLDELRKLGYEPIPDREERRGRSFFHMLRWLKKDRSRLAYAKTGWPRLRRYIRL